MTPSRAVAGIVLLFVALSTAVLLLTPPWEANDEPGHVRNVVELSDGHWYRIKPNPRLTANEAHQPPLYYLGLAGWHRVLGLEDRLPAPVEGGDIFRGGALYAHDGPGEAADERLVRLLRLPNLLAGAAVIVLTYLCARRLTDDRWTPVVAAATVAAVPRLVFLTAVVTNDNLTNVLVAATTYACIRMVTDPPATQPGRGWAALAVGALVGAVVITKLSGVLPAAVTVVAVALMAKAWRERFALIATFGAGSLAVAGWWLVRNQSWYGDPLASAATNAYLQPPPEFRAQESVPEILFVEMPRALRDSFWYTSGWNQLSWPAGWSLVFWALTLAALAGFVRGRGAGVGRRWALRLTALIVAAAGASLWFVGLSNDALPASVIQGRLALPGVAALGCLIAVGWERLRAPVLLRLSLPILGLLGTTYALWDDVWRLYHR